MIDDSAKRAVKNSSADRTMLEAIHAAIELAESDGRSWSDAVDGVDGVCGQDDRYAHDAWYVCTLDDGRTVWETREDRVGADRYAIVDRDD